MTEIIEAVILLAPWAVVFAIAYRTKGGTPDINQTKI